jgi:hypothetical protein
VPKLKKIVVTSILLSAAAFSMSANAGFISGLQTTSGGKSVALQGLEWMPLTYTAGMSRQNIEQADGFTDRFGGVWSSSDWRYASRSETELLLGSLWGGTVSGWSNDNADGANWFLSTFGAIGYDTGYGNSRIDGKYNYGGYQNYDQAYFMFGDVFDCANNDKSTCLGLIGDMENSTLDKTGDDTTGTLRTTYLKNSGPGGWFYEVMGLNAGFNTTNLATDVTYSNRQYGSLLVRQASVGPAPVSSPNAISLFALGLCGLVLNRRRKASQ